jgi:hypothetical protein
MRNAGWLLLAAVLSFAGLAGAQAVFRDGFETPCSSTDVDADGLSGCEEEIAQTDPLLRDTDGDGLADGDELLGTVDGLNLPAFGVRPRHKDILLEYDWIEDASEAGVDATYCPAGITHSHRPTQAMLDVVTAMFAAAPVSNPDGATRIHVVHDMGQGGVFSGGTQIADADGIIQDTVFDADYISKYQAYFAPNRRGYFHWVLMAHRYQYLNDDGSSGYAEIEGSLYIDSMMVTLACHRTVSSVGNTIAHELGHNLRLSHGGPKNDPCNLKPNYNSIMNYRYQFDGVDNDCQHGHSPGGLADFSRGTRNALDEASLSEVDGMCIAVATDFNVDGDKSDILVNWNLNPYGREVDECGATFTVLTDHDDWGSIVLPITTPGGGGDPQPPPRGASCPPPTTN